MEYDSYTRSPPEPRPRDRDDYRSADAYRDRRRSPDRRRPEHTRRRSRSPQIDRYQPDRVPRDDYYRRDDGPRDRRRSSPQPVQNIDRYVPGQDAAPAPLLVNPMPDPMRLEFQVGFTWFAEWWRTEQRIKDDKERVKSGRPQPRLRGERETREEREIERPKIQAAYDSYKENLQKNQAQTFVRLHKSEDWFRERYVDEVRVPFRANLMAFRQGLQAQWEQDLKDGVFDEFTLEGIYKSESNGAGGLLEKEEGETTAAAEVLGVGDLLPSKGGDLRDPVATQPTLLIKTIAPTVTREKFEAFAKELLGEGEGGYKHLSLSDPNPLKKCHRMGWIMLHPVSEPYGEDAVAAAESTDAMEDDDAADKPEQPETKARPLSTSDRALEKIDGKTLEDPERGNFTVHCGVHRPPDAPRKKALWDLFSAPERVARDLELATKLVRKLDNELGDNILGVAMIEQRVQDLEDAGMLEPPALSKPAEKIADADAMDAEDEGEADEDEGQISEADEVDSATLLAQKKKLDLLVEYLRRVYNFCFFCVFEADSVHEMQRKCPGGHLRRPRGSLTSAAKETARASAQGEAFPLKRNGNGHLRTQSSGAEGAEVMDMGDGTESPLDERKGGMMKPSIRNAQQLQRAFNWVKTFEEKILQLLEPENVDVKKLGGVPLEEGMEEELQKYVKQEDISKYRCKALPNGECTKLFKSPEFWRKHVDKRHPDFLAGLKADIELVNTYVRDPSHIAPSRSDANSNGHFPIGNGGGPMGTPRGFMLPGQAGGFAMPGGMIPPGWNAGMMGMMGAAGGFMPPGMNGGGVGPIRNMGRGGGYMNGGGFNGGARIPGPYARNDGRGRAPSFNGGGRGGGMMGMGGAGGGVEGGAGAMGPREAVVGRSLRSYEDLDADKGEGTGELNY